jgi:hypothetical protein
VTSCQHDHPRLPGEFSLSHGMPAPAKEDKAHRAEAPATSVNSILDYFVLRAFLVRYEHWKVLLFLSPRQPIAGAKLLWEGAPSKKVHPGSKERLAFLHAFGCAQNP